MEFATPEELKKVIEDIFKLKERGWGYKKIAKYIGTNHMFVKRVLRFSSPEEAFEHYLKHHFPSEGEPIEEKPPEGDSKPEEKQQKQETKSTTERSVMASADRKVMDTVRRYVRELAVEQIKRILEQGMIVDMLYEEIKKAREERLKKELVWVKLKHEILNEALVYYLTGKISKEKFARVVLATMFT